MPEVATKEKLVLTIEIEDEDMQAYMRHLAAHQGSTIEELLHGWVFDNEGEASSGFAAMTPAERSEKSGY